jgi:solute carrier family 25 (mitochondrial carnitine/acylcarnitine transporter), member 20/29
MTPGLGGGFSNRPNPTPPGHPFDTIKTKMQAQDGFIKGGGMMQSFSTVLRTQGIAGLYKGWWPPLWGSGIYRSTQVCDTQAQQQPPALGRCVPPILRRLSRGPDVVSSQTITPTWSSPLGWQFAVFEAMYTYCENHDLGRTPIPHTAGLEPRVIASGITASFCRAVIECPIGQSGDPPGSWGGLMIWDDLALWEASWRALSLV